MSEPEDPKKSELDALIEQAKALMTQANEVLAKINETKAAAAQSAAASENSKTATDATLAASKTSSDQTSAILEQAKTHQKEINGLLAASKTSATETAEIARTADEKDKRVKKYEEALKKLQAQHLETQEQIEKLLPGATGVGLAKSFNTRKEALVPRMHLAIVIFGISIAGFICLGIWALEVKDFKEFMLFTLERSPIIAGLIILEEFSRRLYNSTQRLEEDYAFKESVSIAFDGYQKAMSSIDTAKDETLAKTLGEEVIKILNDRPGRLLEHVKSDDDIDAARILAGIQQNNAAATPGFLLHVFNAVKAEVRGSAIKAILAIAAAILLGIAIGNYAPNWFDGSTGRDDTVEVDPATP